jgi:hypothetical protein
MGYSLSWIAFKGIEKAEVLERLALVDTGEPDGFCESAVAGCELPSQWFLVYLGDCFHRFVTPEVLGRVSIGCVVLGCQAEEHVMVSAAFLWEDGQRRWNVIHESEKGIYDLAVSGAAPAQFETIKVRVIAEQDAEGGEQSDVDCVYEAPIDLAAEICGFRHEQLVSESPGSPFVPRYPFTILTAARS